MLPLAIVLCCLFVLISSDLHATLRHGRRTPETLHHVVGQVDRRPVHVLLDPRLDLGHDRLRPPYEFAYDVHSYANRFTMISL